MLSPNCPAGASLIELAWGGKLPCTGDFVWSSGRTALRDGIDDWITMGMQQLRLRMSETWQESFDGSPMWNFLVPKGQLSDSIVAGCISPSCDSIGRRFPFVVTFGLPTAAPTWWQGQAITAMPSLLSKTGFLLFSGIRRPWPRETLAMLLAQSLINWQGAHLPPNEGSMVTSGTNFVESDITSVLGNPSIAVTLRGDLQEESSSSSSSPPSDRFTCLPWDDAANFLVAGGSTSFWWTNGTGGAPYKAFTYGAPPDGALMTWLFGAPLSMNPDIPY